MKLLENNKGTSVIEFVIILPLLLALLFGIVEFSIILYDKSVITNASREGARAGIEPGDPRLPDYSSGGNPCAAPPSIDTIARCYCLNNLVTLTTLNDPTTIISGYEANASFGQDLTVIVEYNHQFLFVPSFIPGISNVIALRGETIMKYQ
jgi:hypothetical protein